MTPLVIELDVREWAKQWGLDPALLQALVQSEGDILKAVQKSAPGVRTRGEALMIACRSLTHRLWEYAKGMAQPGDDFPAYFASKWAPVGSANDPTGLNAHLPGNLRTLWHGPAIQEA